MINGSNCFARKSGCKSKW